MENRDEVVFRKKYQDPVVDPNETWGHMMTRMVDFKKPPLVRTPLVFETNLLDREIRAAQGTVEQEDLLPTHQQLPLQEQNRGGQRAELEVPPKPREPRGESPESPDSTGIGSSERGVDPAEKSFHWWRGSVEENRAH